MSPDNESPAPHTLRVRERHVSSPQPSVWTPKSPFPLTQKHKYPPQPLILNIWQISATLCSGALQTPKSPGLRVQCCPWRGLQSPFPHGCPLGSACCFGDTLQGVCFCGVWSLEAPCEVSFSPACNSPSLCPLHHEGPEVGPCAISESDQALIWHADHHLLSSVQVDHPAQETAVPPDAGAGCPPTGRPSADQQL